MTVHIHLRTVNIHLQSVKMELRIRTPPSPPVKVYGYVDVRQSWHLDNVVRMSLTEFLRPSEESIDIVHGLDGGLTEDQMLWMAQCLDSCENECHWEWEDRREEWVFWVTIPLD